jgi:hypothetical protein
MMEKLQKIAFVIMCIIPILLIFDLVKFQKDSEKYKHDLLLAENISKYNKNWIYDDLKKFLINLDYLKSNETELKKNKMELEYLEMLQEKDILKQKKDIQDILDSTKMSLDNIWDNKEIDEIKITGYYDKLFSTVTEKIRELKIKVIFYNIIDYTIKALFVLSFFTFFYLQFFYFKKRGK